MFKTWSETLWNTRLKYAQSVNNICVGSLISKPPVSIYVSIYIYLLSKYWTWLPAPFCSSPVNTETFNGLNHWRRKWNFPASCHNCHITWISAQREIKLCLTSESPVYSLDSSGNHTDASLLNPSARSHSDPALSDGRGCTSELSPEKHRWSLTNCSLSIWIKNKLCHFKKQCLCLKWLFCSELKMV